MKKAKITKQSYAYKGCANTYNFEMFNSFNPELQVKDTESVIRNKEPKDFKFVTILVK